MPVISTCYNQSSNVIMIFLKSRTVEKDEKLVLQSFEIVHLDLWRFRAPCICWQKSIAQASEEIRTEAKHMHLKSLF